MKLNLQIILVLISIAIFSACSTSNNIYRNTKNYKPDDPELYETITALDSIFFEAYNTCNINLEKYSSFYSEDIEFFHDKGGLMTSKKEIIESMYDDENDLYSYYY